MSSTAKNKDPNTFTIILIVAIVVLLTFAFKNLRSSLRQQEPPAGEVPRAETEKERQSRLWAEGMAAGKHHLESGATPLDNLEIARLAEDKFPSDKTADVLWSIGFTQGQALPAQSKR